jgi:hypothetical protein
VIIRGGIARHARKSITKKQIQALAIHPDDAALQLLSTTQDQCKREQGAANNEFRRSIIIIF